MSDNKYSFKGRKMELLESLKTEGSEKRKISKVTDGNGKYKIVEELYAIKGGAVLKILSDGDMKILGGRENAERSKKNIENLLKENHNLSEEELSYYEAISNLLDNYIKERIEVARKKAEKNDDKENKDNEDEKAPEDVKGEEKNKEEKGNKKMSEVENLNEQIDKFAKRVDDLRGKEEYSKVNDEIRRLKLHLEKYQDELDNLHTGKQQYNLDSNNPVDTRKMNHVESIKAERELKDTIEETKKRLNECEEKKTNLDKARNSSSTKKAESELRDEKSKYFTQTKMRLENEVRDIKHQMEGILIQLNNFQYEYKEGTRIPTNGDKLRELNEQYEALKGKSSDIQAAIKICDEQKDLLKKEFEEAVKPINDIISRKDDKVATESGATKDSEKNDKEENVLEEDKEEKVSEENRKEEKAPEEDKAEKAPDEELKEGDEGYWLDDEEEEYTDDVFNKLLNSVRSARSKIGDSVIDLDDLPEEEVPEAEEPKVDAAEVEESKRPNVNFIDFDNGSEVKEEIIEQPPESKREDSHDKDAGNEKGSDEGALLVNGVKQYNEADFMTKHRLKVESWAIENKRLDVPLFQRIRLFLPSKKYKEIAMRHLSTGRLVLDGDDIYENIPIGKEENSGENRASTDPFQKQSRTPIPEKDRTPEKQEKEDDRIK